MFWGAFSLEVKGPVHFYATETVVEKKAAQEDLQDINADYNAEAQLKHDEWKTENAKRAPFKQLKRVWKPESRPKERKKELKEDVN